MEKYFLTYQPSEVANILKEKDYGVISSNYDAIKKEFGYNPIFFIPIENKVDLLIKNYLASPSKPEVMIITKLDTYDCIDAAKWFEVKGNEKIHDTLGVNENNPVEKEYIAPVIFKKHVAKIIYVDEIFSADSLKKGYINDLNKSKMLMYQQRFWEILEPYYPCVDERDIFRFSCSKEVTAFILSRFGPVMLQKSTGGSSQENAIRFFRENVMKLADQFKWF